MYDKDADMRQWVAAHGSGALAKAAKNGAVWMPMAMYERLAFEVGAGAMLVQRSRVTMGDFIAQCDCQITREMQWYHQVLAHRWADSKTFSEQNIKIEQVHFTITDEEGEKKEGVGFKVTGLTRPWFPKGRVLILQLALWDPNKKSWYDHKNPL